MAYTETPEAKAIRIERDLARREVLLAGTAEEQTYKPKKKHERVRPKKGGKMNGEAFNNNSNGSARGHQGFYGPRNGFHPHNRHQAHPVVNPPFAPHLQPDTQTFRPPPGHQNNHPRPTHLPLTPNTKPQNTAIIAGGGFNKNALESAGSLKDSRWATSGRNNYGIQRQCENDKAAELHRGSNLSTSIAPLAGASVEPKDKETKAEGPTHKAEIEEKQVKTVPQKATEAEIDVEPVEMHLNINENKARAKEALEQQLKDVSSKSEDMKLRLSTSEQQCKDWEARCTNAEQAVSARQEQIDALLSKIQLLDGHNQDLSSGNMDLNRRLVAFQKVAVLDQEQLKESDDKVRRLQDSLMTTRQLLQNADVRCIDLAAITRERDGLRQDLERARDYYENQVGAMAAAVRKANGKHEGCSLKGVTKQLEAEQTAHEEVKTQISVGHAKVASAESELAASQANLKTSQREAEKRMALIHKLEEELKKEKENSDFANLLLVKPTKKCKMQRNRKFDPAKEAKKLQKEAERLKMKAKPISNELVLYRPYHSCFSAPAKSCSILVASPLVVCGPLPAFPKVVKLGGEKFVGSSLVKMEMDNPVYHDINRIRCITDRSRFTNEETSHLVNIGMTPDSTPAPKENRASSKWYKFGIPRSAKHLVNKLLVVVMTILSLVKLCNLDTQYTNFNSAKYVSASPSCGVFGSALSVVETTCPWEPPKPSALALFASTTLSAPQPSISELFWIDTGDMTGNCSWSDKVAHEQTIDDDARDIPREIDERRIAIGITVTVVIPTVVVSAIAFSFGWI
ncbi:hypothetical protein ACEPPN_010236 [Leptodophora sp. 'Broadleaf-Isolate-01']